MASFSYDLDRASNRLTIYIDYYIAGYGDPETGEYFSDTSWTATVTNVATGNSGSTAGTGGESGNAMLDFGLTSGQGDAHFVVSFTAHNTFSGVTDTASFDVNVPALETGDLVVGGTSGADLLAGGFGHDVLDGLAANDSLNGGDGNDTLIGGLGSDTLDGAAGADSMAGGVGDDHYAVDSSDDLVVEAAGEGYDTITANVSYTLPANVERLMLIGFGPLVGTGGAGDDEIVGHHGADLLRGEAGDDLLRGAGGNDTLLGGAGNDRLDGAVGDDVMRGNVGDDTYVVDSVGDRILEAASAGIDTVLSSGLASYALGAHIEHLEVLPVGYQGDAPSIRVVGNGLANSITGGSGDDTLNGGDGSDSLFGNAGNDRFIGGAGADLILGGDGADTVVYSTSATAVIVRLDRSAGLGGDAAGDDIRGVENVVGSGHADLIVGHLLANHFVGGAGDDTLIGGHGNDTLIGGAGADVLHGGMDRDLVSYAGSTAGAIVLDLSAGTASGGDASGDTLVAIEDAITGSGDDHITGTGHANWLRGGEGDDTIIGGAGNDTIAGGGGADSLDGGAGIDTLSYAQSSQAVYITLSNPSGIPGDMHLAVGGEATDDHAAGFENVAGGFGDDRLVGSDIGNVLTGGAGNDTLDGLGGNDTLVGGAGADTLSGGAGNDTLSYAGAQGRVVINLGTNSVAEGDAEGDVVSGFENVVGGSGHDHLTGSAGANRIVGGAGFDWLAAGAGDDTLVGGADGDTFAFEAGHGHDVIVDFMDGDLLSFALGAAFDTFEEVIAMAQDTATGTVLRFSATDTITLRGVTTASLNADDMTFI